MGENRTVYPILQDGWEPVVDGGAGKPMPQPRADETPEPMPAPRADGSPEPTPASRVGETPEPTPAPRAGETPEPTPAFRADGSPEPTPAPRADETPEPTPAFRAGEGAGNKPHYLLALDTANEVIAIGLGILRSETCSIDLVAQAQTQARRASNTQLLPRIDALLVQHGIGRSQLACVACGRGPGSFTGVRIAMATAKGIASALGVPLVGVSSLDAVAWGAWAEGVRGPLYVVADAMRKEVYPVHFLLSEDGMRRLGADRVAKAEAAAYELHREAKAESIHDTVKLQLAGDALGKYADLFAPYGTAVPEQLWTPSGRGLLLAVQAAWRAGEVDPFDELRHNPAFALPVYTRLSDAEENERVRLAKSDPKDLATGVQGGSFGRHPGGFSVRPLDAARAPEVAALEQQLMGTDAWNENLVLDELPRKDRVWWCAVAPAACPPACGAGEGQPPATPSKSLRLVGYAGGWVVDGDLQILKVGVDPVWQRQGVARELLFRVAADARDLGAETCSLEVRSGNAAAQALYRALGLREIGTRPRYYSDHEDARIMQGSLDLLLGRVPQGAQDPQGARVDQGGRNGGEDQAAQGNQGRCDASSSGVSPGGTVRNGGREQLCAMGLRTEVQPAPAESRPLVRPLILAIESSCDETAAAIVDGEGTLLSNVVASQIDFHARFGGVVPEIASRKHIEAICGVCDECLHVAAASLGLPQLGWADLNAVAATYAPGLVGALVVGVAFAKGAAWGQDLPFIGVNHLEGHLYANKIGSPAFAPPAVVSLVSGGNTLLVHMRDWGRYETLGATIDDAVGEAFDKVSKALGLGYPGGPVISRYAAQGNPDAIPFPRAMLHSGDLRFSLSGLKTAVITYLNQERAAGREPNIPDVAASFQQAVVDVQVAKAETALKQTGAPEFCLGGGVAANPVLRAAYQDMCDRLGVHLTMPPLSACGDNAGMIALVALDRYRQGRFFGLDADAHAHANLDEPY